MIKCCYYCTNDRYPGCHGKCEKYKKEREEFDREKALADADREVRNYEIEKISKGLAINAKKRASNRARFIGSKGRK